MPRRTTRDGLIRRLWRDYSLSIVVAALFLVSFLLHAVFGWWQYAADQEAHAAEATLFGADGYVVYFGEWTFQNWQSEFLEVLLLIVATKYLIHKGSPESRDGQDEMQAAIERIEKKLDAMEKST
jgi:succinate dehydrogenase hydrophobic anchor subunit